VTITTIGLELIGARRMCLGRRSGSGIGSADWGGFEVAAMLRTERRRDGSRFSPLCLPELKVSGHHPLYHA